MAKKKEETTPEEVVEFNKVIEEAKAILAEEAPKEEVKDEVPEVEPGVEPETPVVEEVPAVEEIVAETPLEEVIAELNKESFAGLPFEPVAEGHTQEFETPEYITNSFKDVEVLDVSVLLEKIQELYSLKEKDPVLLRELYELCRWNCIRFGLPLRDLRELFAEAGLELK